MAKSVKKQKCAGAPTLAAGLRPTGEPCQVQGGRAPFKKHDDPVVAKPHRPKSLVQFFRESPLVGVKLDLERDRRES
jgi:hypothetical protein